MNADHLQDSGVSGAEDPFAPMLALALAEELVALTIGLSELAYDLGSDPQTLRRHMSSLQAIDAVTQGQLAIADVLRSKAPIADRVAAITLEALRTSLTNRLVPMKRPESAEDGGAVKAAA